MPEPRHRIAVVGGGFTGTAMAVQLARAGSAPLHVTVIEPRERPGPGLAYSTPDPDHRINAGAGTHMLDPADAGAFARWCERNGIEAGDPEARAANGHLYPRRRDFGAFLAAEFERHREGPGGARLHHVRDRAVGLEGREVRTGRSGVVEADLVVIATGNAPGPMPPPLESLRGHPALVDRPLEPGRLGRVAPEATVLVVGSGLTALDAISTLLRAGHRGAITVVSRQGWRPTPAPPAGAVTTAEELFRRIAGDLPAEVAHAVTARALLRGMRQRIAAAAAQGGSWFLPFDEVRDVVWKLWPRLPLPEKRRFLRRLRPVYDAHRFRAPPQNDALVQGAEARGQVVYRLGRLSEARDHGGALRVTWRSPGGEAVEGDFDAVLNCTGLDPSGGAADNPFLSSLLASGVLSRDPCGVGFAVDAECRPIGRDGSARPGLRVVGPPSAGTWGDPLGALFIAPQVARVVPGILAELRAGLA